MIHHKSDFTILLFYFFLFWVALNFISFWTLLLMFMFFILIHTTHTYNTCKETFSLMSSVFLKHILCQQTFMLYYLGISPLLVYLVIIHLFFLLEVYDIKLFKLGFKKAHYCLLLNGSSYVSFSLHDFELYEKCSLPNIEMSIYFFFHCWNDLKSVRCWKVNWS